MAEYNKQTTTTTKAKLITALRFQLRAVNISQFFLSKQSYSDKQRHRGLKLTDTNPSSGLVLFFFILAWKANHQREMVNENFSQSYFLWHCQGGIQILIHSFKSVFMKLINFLISLRMGIFFLLFRVISWFHWIFFFTKQPNSLGSWK